MYTTKLLTAGVLAVLLAVASSCSKDYFDINNNPNQVTDASPQLVLPDALANTGSYVTTNFPFLNLWMGYWNFSGGYGINSSEKNYNFTNLYSDVRSPGSARTTNIWNDAYTNLKNYNFIDTRSGQLGQPYLQGAAKIMKAFTFQYLVDTYGNIPYTDALQGTTVIQPKYDPAQTIYEDLVKQIDAGLALLASSQGTLNPGANDIVFAGDASKWLKFGNTLKLRLLLRQSEKADRAAYIQTQLATIKASNYGFLGAGENAGVNPGYVNSANLQSPFYGVFGYGVNGKPIEANNYYKGNGYGIAFYQSNKDPRLGAYYAPVPGSTNTYNGTLFGTLDTQPNSAVSGIGAGLLKSVSQPSVLIASHESLFMQAEAAQRGWITGDPKALYQAAISESFVNVGRTAAEATTYYSQTGLRNVNWEASPNKIEAIITQKWASENGVDPFEAWSDYRRLGLPATIPISLDPTVTTAQIPVRLFYPASEQSTNATNVATQGNVSQFASKIFWMK